MKMYWKLPVLAMFFAPFLLAAGAQTVTIDPALLAKANAGDPAAEVKIGEITAAAAANLHSTTAAGAAYKAAAEWYTKAASKDNLPSELNADLHLAALYRDGGKGFPRDMAQAAAWYQKAADQGDASSQATLGLLYSIGQGLPQDYVEAYFWLDLAASEPGPNQQHYAANRQMVGMQLTVDQVGDTQDRVTAWLAAHPRAGAAKN